MKVWTSHIINSDNNETVNICYSVYYSFEKAKSDAIEYLEKDGYSIINSGHGISELTQEEKNDNFFISGEKNFNDRIYFFLLEFEVE